MHSTPHLTCVYASIHGRWIVQLQVYVGWSEYTSYIDWVRTAGTAMLLQSPVKCPHPSLCMALVMWEGTVRQQQCLCHDWQVIVLDRFPHHHVFSCSCWQC